MKVIQLVVDSKLKRTMGVDNGLMKKKRRRWWCEYKAGCPAKSIARAKAKG